MIFQGKRVFIIEDNLSNLAVFATMLRKEGAIMIQDPWNYGIASRLIQNLPVDLILLDLMLRNGRSGYDVFDELQQHPQLKDIPVVVISALDGEVEIPKAKEKGFAGFIGKPVRAYSLARQLEPILRGETVWLPGI